MMVLTAPARSPDTRPQVQHLHKGAHAVITQQMLETLETLHAAPLSDRRVLIRLKFPSGLED
jgi:hypothetical protein